MTRTTPSRRLPKFHRAPKDAPRMRLTDRDRAVLYDLFHYRYLPASLVTERHFGSDTRSRARLKLLFHHGFVDRTFLPTVGPTHGEAIYSLGPRAVGELATFYGVEPAEVKKRRRRIEPFFLAHQLLVARFRIRLAYAGAPRGVAVRDWREETAAKLAVDGSSVTPDGMAWLEAKGARFAFCLEADRGTMTVGRVKAKYKRYRAAQAAGVMKRHFGAARFRVLVVAPSERRLESLRAAAEGGVGPNVWLVTEDDLDRDLVADAIWRRPGKTERFPLFRERHLAPRKAGRDGPGRDDNRATPRR